MNRTDLHPIEALLLVAAATLWALWTVARTLLVPALALLLVLARWRPTAPAAAVTAGSPVAAVTPPPAPLTAGTQRAATAPQPSVTAGSQTGLTAPQIPVTLADLAQQAAATLEPLTVAQLRQQARAAGLPRALTRTGRRAALLEALSWAEVAMA